VAADQTMADAGVGEELGVAVRRLEAWPEQRCARVG
jgi:hypothetical protein